MAGIWPTLETGITHNLSEIINNFPPYPRRPIVNPELHQPIVIFNRANVT